ncbi:stage III sporulation protein AE [Candidatus Epulonipiscium viviparus]|uniref:stage III sporulation protein AE n=1 Tax=Candidatus Epulonipiscium viviparus TaxID=420336 RepID=UPI00049501D1|nr:stage III sporulation protein AE [Candidatus Epulopiscium viviparus]
MQKIKLLIALVICLFGVCETMATEEAGSINTDLIIETQLEMFNWDEIEKLEADLSQNVPELKDFDLKHEVGLVLSGQKKFNLETILEFIKDSIFAEFFTYLNVIVRFILIVIVCNMLNNLSAAFDSKNTTKIAFFVCNIVILYSVMQSLVLIVELAHKTIETLQGIMLIMLPTLLAFMAASGYIATSAAMSPVVIGALNMMVFIIQNILLPNVVIVVILQILNQMSNEFEINKLIALYYKVNKWILGTIFGSSIAILGIYRMSLPFTDVTMKRVGLSLSTKLIPIVGNAVGGAVDMIIQISGMIKNAFGVGVIIFIVIVIAMPLIKIFAYIFLYHVAGAIIEPLGDKKMAKIATDIAKGCEFVMSCVGTVSILSILALVVCMSVGSGLL